MKQVVVIPGGDSFLRRKDFLRYLRSIKVTTESLKSRRDWKANLQADLGRTWQVIQLTMPNKMNARYEEWKIWMEKFRPLIKANPVFIGHSLGGIFLARYFNEYSWPKKIKAIILVAPPYHRTEGVGSFRLRRSLKMLVLRTPRIFIFHSNDDPIVSFMEMAAYAKALPQATLKPLTRRGHITQSHFPELVRFLKTL